MQTPGSGGNRKATGKRKLYDRNTESAEDLTRRQQGTLPDLFSKGRGNPSSCRNRHLSPTNKRVRRDEPVSPGAEDTQGTGDLMSVDKMYNFAGSDSKSNNAFALNRSENATSPAGCRKAQPSNFTPHTGAKKLVVKNLRAVPRLDQDQYFEKVWAQLDSALSAIFDDKKPAQSLEELYKGAENVCRQKRAPNLAKRLQDRCKGYMAGKVLPSMLTKAADADDVDVLRAAEAAWSVWSSKLVTIRSIFYYLDQAYLLRSPDNPTIHEMGLLEFRTTVFSNSSLKQKILRGASHLIDLDRNDQTSFDSTLLSRAIKLFHSLGVYTTDFEPYMVEGSGVYFSSWAETESSNYLATYVDKCHRLIEREISRCDLFALPTSTKQKLSELLDQNLVAQQTGELLDEKDLLGLLRTNNQIALEQLYSLLDRIDLGTDVKSAFCSYIVEEGTSIVFDPDREGEMVVRLLELKENSDTIWQKSFHKNEALGHALRESFETFINRSKKSDPNWGNENPKPGEMIAKHVDLLLRGGLRAIQNQDVQSKSAGIPVGDEDAELNKQLDQVLALFRFVHGKAVFEAFYKNDLARRLLMGRSASDDAEKGMLARLKSECGSNFTHNLESMFKDIDLARDEMASYNSLLRERQDRRTMDLNVNVLSASAWPSYPDVPVNVPQKISRALDDFEQFYNTKYNGRKLQWKHSLAHCQLKARFPNGNKEIVVSSFQAIVLLLFNEVADGEFLNYKDLQSATGLSDPELQRTLQSLACAKYRVLTKRPKGKDVKKTDEFCFNTGFSHPKMRIKINQIQLKETKEENRYTHERVAEDRHLETQAAIMRIMKSRKALTHQELVVEVIKATKSRGVLDQAGIKKNIEKLLEKEYLERDGDEGSNRYKYIS